MMKSEKYIPALEEWTLSTEGEISGVKIVYLVPNELVGEAERLGAVKILKDEKEDNK